eukprot:202244-Pyramimonas_sp.AAC.1
MSSPPRLQPLFRMIFDSRFPPFGGAAELQGLAGAEAAQPGADMWQRAGGRARSGVDGAIL